MIKSMLRHLRDTRAEELEGEGAGEAGFTLIELMVVLLIIAILLAIAIPTFLGVTSGANDRAAQSNLTNAMTESAAIYQNNGQAFPDPTVASCNGAGTTSCYTQGAPEFKWVTAQIKNSDTNYKNEVGVAVTNGGQTVALADLSQTGTCWYIVDVAAGTGAGTFYGNKTAAADCNASNATAANTTGPSYSSPTTGIGT
jgi:type IV pilus assembly protein PilA